MRCDLKQQDRWSDAALTGAMVGLAAALRPAGLPFLALFFAISRIFFMTTGRDTFLFWKETFRWVTHLITAWLVMVSLWPWAHENIFINPVTAMVAAADFAENYPVLFGGAILQSNQLPWSYLLTYLMITTPLPVIVLALLGLMTSVGRGNNNEKYLHTMVACWFLIPMIAFVIMRPNIYDGLRHFLFVLPAVAILAARGASFVAGMGRRVVTIPLLIIVLLLPVKSLVSLHPYQMTYFNVGAGSVNERYETDYWLTSYREAAEWINSQPGKNKRVLIAANRFGQHCATHFFNDSVGSAQLLFTTDNLPPTLPEKFDYYLSTTRFSLDKNFADTPVVKTIGRGGNIFVVVRKSRP